VFPARSILVLDLTPFDQSLELVPTIRALRAVYPNALIVGASSTGTCQLLHASGLVQDTIDLGSLRRQPVGRTLLRLARRARAKNFDLVIDFSPQVATQLLARFFLRSRTVSATTGPDLFGALLGWLGLPLRPRARRSRYESLLEVLDLRLEDRRIQVPLPNEENERFEQRLARNKFRGGEPLVVLHSNMSGSWDEWPVSNFADLANRLSNNFGVRMVVADEPGDSIFSASISAYLSSSAVVLDRPEALQLGAAVARASVVVTDSEGVARFAEELGAPVVVPRQRATDQVYDEVAETLLASRSASLFKR
jgi:ADP-heptose:LPS heptosyltransferase